MKTIANVYETPKLVFESVNATCLITVESKYRLSLFSPYIYIYITI